MIMGDEPRPVSEEMTQEEQNNQMLNTFNGPTVYDEDVLVNAMFGPQDVVLPEEEN